MKAERSDSRKMIHFTQIGLCLLGFTLAVACTVRVEPLAKPKPRVVYVHSSTHHKKHHAKPSPTPHGMIPSEEQVPLIHSTPIPPDAR